MPGIIRESWRKQLLVCPTKKSCNGNTRPGQKLIKYLQKKPAVGPLKGWRKKKRTAIAMLLLFIVTISSLLLLLLLSLSVLLLFLVFAVVIIKTLFRMKNMRTCFCQWSSSSELANLFIKIQFVWKSKAILWR